MIKSYVVAADGGFAPNPYGKALTLACCKPIIRRTAQVGDWILGTHPKRINRRAICYLGRVKETKSFDEYYHDKRFRDKRPSESLEGDAIYVKGDGEKLIQIENNFHNRDNYDRDTQTDRVLICKEFWYFGKKKIILPEDLADDLIKTGPGHRNVTDVRLIERLLSFVRRYPMGMQGQPSDPAACVVKEGICSSGQETKRKRAIRRIAPKSVC